MSNENKKPIENFLMDIDILDQLDYKLSNFNAFETLGIFNTEIRHSNVLGWLLNPNENHGLGDTFIKKFVQHVFYNTERVISNSNFTLFDVSLMNYSDFFVRREWQDIDVLVISEINKIVIIIENKVWSKESKYQLKKYFTIVNNEYPDYHKLFLFLTPDGEAASDGENWLSIDYSFVLEILSNSMLLKRNALSSSVKDFLEQYMEIIRRYIVGDEELEKICRDIYFKHQKALDLIFEYKPDTYSEIANYIQENVTNEENLILDHSNKTYIRFTHKALDDCIPLAGRGWTRTKRLVLFEIQNKAEKLVLKLIIGPGESETRENIYQIASENRSIFKQMSNRLTPAYTTIFSKELLPKQYLERFDSMEDIKKRIDKVWNKFLTGDMEKITEALRKGI